MKGAAESLQRSVTCRGGLSDSVRFVAMPRVFKNQNYSKLRKQLQTSGALFEDPEFPATDKSLYTADGGPSSSQREIEWKRPKVRNVDHARGSFTRSRVEARAWVWYGYGR